MPTDPERAFNEVLDCLGRAQEAMGGLGEDRVALQVTAVLAALRGALLSGEHAHAALDNLSAAVFSAAEQNLRLLTEGAPEDRPPIN